MTNTNCLTLGLTKEQSDSPKVLYTRQWNSLRTGLTKSQGIYLRMESVSAQAGSADYHPTYSPFYGDGSMMDAALGNEGSSM